MQSIHPPAKVPAASHGCSICSGFDPNHGRSAAKFQAFFVTICTDQDQSLHM